MDRRIILALAVCLVALGGCGSSEPETSASDIGSETVPITFKGTDDTVVVQKSASVTDEDYYKPGSSTETEALGQVTLRAKTATTTPGSNQHYFSGRVVRKDGTTAECDEGRSIIWSDFGVFEDIELRCDDYVLPGDVRSFELDLS